MDDFGARGDGITDDTNAINAAIASLSAGGTVVFTPGKIYRKTGTILVRVPGVRLWGYGATMYAVVSDFEVVSGKGVPGIAIRLEAPNTGVYGLTMISNLRSRLIGHPNNAGVYLAADGQVAVDNRFEYTGNGVFVTGTNFVVARNVVYRTWADGIHTTHDASSGLFASVGRVLCNVVREVGDDMISVASYGIGEPTIGSFLVEGNDLANQYWGRGIAIIGGRDITIRRNHIAYTTHGAGILINSEAYYGTANVHNVLVEDNEISEVQTTPPPFNPKGVVTRTGQGAIDINGQSAVQEVTRVLIRTNYINRTARDGILVRNNIRDVGLVDNTFGDVGQRAIHISADRSAVFCWGNNVKGTPISPANCDGSSPIVTGASF